MLDIPVAEGHSWCLAEKLEFCPGNHQGTARKPGGERTGRNKGKIKENINLRKVKSESDSKLFCQALVSSMVTPDTVSQTQ